MQKRKFAHLQYEQRLQIEALYSKGTPKREIAAFVGCSLSTLYNELKRGMYERLNGETWETVISYSADIAQKDYDYKATAKGAELKLGNDWNFVHFVERKILKEKYSPAAVLASIQQQGLSFPTKVCKATLYNYIDAGLFPNLTNERLPYGGRRRHSHPRPVRPNIQRPLAASIDDRPTQTREEFGHWEMDTVVGTKAGKSTCLLVLTERKTRYELIMKMRAKTAECTVRALNNLERMFESKFSKVFKTIACDNGPEFFDTKGIERRGRTKVYYCHPYCSSERGSNENANRLIRRWFPKGKSMVKLRPAQVAYVQRWMNTYPRNIHNYQTSGSLFVQEMEKLGFHDKIPTFT